MSPLNTLTVPKQMFAEASFMNNFPIQFIFKICTESMQFVSLLNLYNMNSNVINCDSGFQSASEYCRLNYFLLISLFIKSKKTLENSTKIYNDHEQ